jgi:SAM-dependent methyltransferase
MSFLRRLLTGNPSAAPAHPPAAQAEQARIIFLDRPPPDTPMRAGQAFDGWTISPDPSETISGTANGAPLRIHTIPRPDVETARPGRNAKGFMFFFEPDPAVAGYRIHLRLGDIARELAFTVAPEERAEAARMAAIRTAHRAFLKGALACAMCHAAFDPDEVADRLWSCRACGTAFDCRAGLDLIPETYANKRDIAFQGAICSHEYDELVTAIIDGAAGNGGMVLDCGAGWRQRMRPNVITTEILRYPSTDVVAVGEHLPFRDGAFDAVLSLHVLEHVKNPFVCARELVRVLKPGGTLFAVTPYVVSVHGYPFHFFNPTPSGLRALFDGLIVDPTITVPRVAHPLAALKDLLGVYADHFDPADRAAFRDTKVGDLLDASFNDVLEGPLVRTFRDSGKHVLAGNYAISGRKA